MANENHVFHSKWQEKCVLCVVMWRYAHTRKQHRLPCCSKVWSRSVTTGSASMDSTHSLGYLVAWIRRCRTSRYTGCTLRDLSIRKFGYLREVLEPIPSYTEGQLYTILSSTLRQITFDNWEAWKASQGMVKDPSFQRVFPNAKTCSEAQH